MKEHGITGIVCEEKGLVLCSTGETYLEAIFLSDNFPESTPWTRRRQSMLMKKLRDIDPDFKQTMQMDRIMLDHEHKVLAQAMQIGSYSSRRKEPGLMPMIILAELIAHWARPARGGLWITDIKDIILAD